MSASRPEHGDVWDLNFNPTQGREQVGHRPALLVSVSNFNQGPAELVVAIPLTRSERKVRWHVAVKPPEGGLSETSYIKCEDVRSLSKGRLTRYRGRVSAKTMGEARIACASCSGCKRAQSRFSFTPTTHLPARRYRLRCRARSKIRGQADHRSGRWSN